MHFAHLHVYSDGSLLDSTVSVKSLLAKVKALNMDCVALTDQNNLFNAIEFYRLAKQEGINPIIGCQLSVFSEPGTPLNRRSFPLKLLASHQQGYRNLLKLVSLAHADPSRGVGIDFQQLEPLKEGLIALSGGSLAEITEALATSHEQWAYQTARRYSTLFSPQNFYIELQNHKMGDQKEAKLNPTLAQLAQDLNLELVASNRVHYLEEQDHEAHDILLCIKENTKQTQTDRLRLPSKEFYLKSPSQMHDLFKEYPQALENTIKIAQRCNLDISFPGPLLPHYPVPSDFNTPAAYLKNLTYKGLKKRYSPVSSSMQERLDYELDVIISMGFESYFLIVWDFITYAKKNAIPVGPGRGSGAGSLVAYALEITEIDPLAYDLLFERFLNPQRISMPDFDIDFCYEKRGQVLEYVYQKYGQDHVAQIITFGTLKAKAVLKDAARALDIPFENINGLTKSVDNEDLRTLYERNKLFKEKSKEPLYQKLFSISAKLEGLKRHISTHAAGLVIGKTTLSDYVPLYKEANSPPSTQYTMEYLEDCGLIKMDFLGLKTLTLLKEAENLVQQQHPDFNLEQIPDKDLITFKLLGMGQSLGVFQFESQGMRNILRQAQPSCLEDLVALTSLYRPGPMQFIPQYIKAKNNLNLVKYPHNDLKEVLKTTYGVIIYQEQVMRVAQIIGDFSLSEADLLRRAMGKKKQEEMQKLQSEFLQGAQKKGYSSQEALHIFQILQPFANYGFNKSHAVAYSLLSYQTAYLKANHPLEFMVANLNNEIQNPAGKQVFIDEMTQVNLPLLPPDINRSLAYFGPEAGAIRYGLLGIKNLGSAVAQEILNKRKSVELFSSLEHFLEMVDSRIVNKKVLEALIACGIFDSLGENRLVLLSNLKAISDYLLKLDSDHKEQLSIFDVEASKTAQSSLKELFTQNTSPFSTLDKAQLEYEYLGYYASEHPLGDIKALWTYHVDLNLQDCPYALQKNGSQKVYKLIGRLKQVKKIQTKTKQTMAFALFEDFLGSIELILFQRIFEKYQDICVKDSIVALQGRLDGSRGEIKFIVDKVEDHKNLKLGKSLHIYLKEFQTKEALKPLMDQFEQRKKQNTLKIYLHSQDKQKWLLPEHFSFPLEKLPQLENLTLIEKVYLEEAPQNPLN